MALVPQVVDSVRIPVLAAGGLADGRGLVACLALGAQGAVFGTRFIASEESQAAAGYREALVRAHEDDTIRTRCYTGKPARAIRTSYAEEWERKQDEIKPFPVQMVVSAQAGVVGYAGRGGGFDPDRTFMPAGQGTGLIHEIKPAAEIFGDIVREAQTVIAQRFQQPSPTARPA
jgi:enoyl-[acyl-carrier protein] reductase II